MIMNSKNIALTIFILVFPFILAFGFDDIFSFIPNYPGWLWDGDEPGSGRQSIIIGASFFTSFGIAILIDKKARN